MSQASQHAPPSPPELAARWQALGQEWAHWYARAASGLPGGSAVRAATEIKVPAAIAPGAFDPQQLERLDAVASRERRSRSFVVRDAIEHELSRLERRLPVER